MKKVAMRIALSKKSEIHYDHDVSQCRHFYQRHSKSQEESHLQTNWNKITLHDNPQGNRNWKKVEQQIQKWEKEDKNISYLVKTKLTSL